ncbi:hypothetical protein HN51_024260 [Arachis hypogaea]|uniref:uncharacterized protein n=1 Tax=Arachis hypogaea TaxID=3818 RepID=UPI000DECD554|nr:uncharacterized protein LOC112702375 [Arachis hypogaea]QHO27290.1 uncharacterized protein DS421_7g206740 [Arachis hypogaea]
MDSKPEKTFDGWISMEEVMKLPVINNSLYDKDAPLYSRRLKAPTTPYVLTEAQIQFERKQMHPYHVLAMDHYNKSIDNEEEEYKISSLVNMGKTRTMCFGEHLGFLRHLFWEAVPKNTSSVEPKVFYARVHEMFQPRGIHVAFCGFYNDSVDDSESCEICGLKNSDEFWKKEKELKDKEAERVKAIHNEYLYPIHFSGMYQSPHGDNQTMN